YCHYLKCSKVIRSFFFFFFLSQILKLSYGVTVPNILSLKTISSGVTPYPDFKSDVIVPGFTNTQWLENFRMSKETFVHLCNKLCPAMERRDTNFRVCVPLNKRVAIALWKLATGTEYRSVGHLFGVSITTVCRCVQEFCAASEVLLVPEQIHYPDQVKFKEMAAYIENRWGLPHCIGAIDGSHIPIIAPEEYHCDYFNHKCWHSIILQGVVDAKGLFWNVFTGLPGSLHDARVLRLSTLWELASRGNHIPANTRNIGGVTPVQNWLLKPFIDTGHLTAEQQVYNMKICRARVVVENAFGRLKGRWRCLMKKNDCAVNLVKSMVLYTTFVRVMENPMRMLGIYPQQQKAWWQCHRL
uniref:DDE Tnp4 domain-containing protein n=1 Tax=Cyprinus carpio TaxID=7962 RepID=A0A8C1S5R1_CYPCA